MKKVAVFGLLVLVAGFVLARSPQELIRSKEGAFQALPEGSKYSLSPAGVPREVWLRGTARPAASAREAGLMAIYELGPLFRLRGGGWLP